MRGLVTLARSRDCVLRRILVRADPGPEPSGYLLRLSPPAVSFARILTLNAESNCPSFLLQVSGGAERFFDRPSSFVAMSTHCAMRRQLTGLYIDRNLYMEEEVYFGSTGIQVLKGVEFAIH
jgi:hypothetical protein